MLKIQYNEDNLSGTFSTKIGFRKWVLALDCDSEADKDVAVLELGLQKLGFKAFQSSPNHYWIITNYVASHKKCLEKMKTIPGVDPSFKHFCYGMKGIYIRAFPKNAFLPSLEIGFSPLSSKVLKFVGLVREWFSSETPYWILFQQQKKVNEVLRIQYEQKELEQKKIKAEDERRTRRVRLFRLEGYELH